MAEFETDVLVVGTGPTGATAALALATYGVRVHAVTQWNWLANTPRAHITNQRAVEVLRDLGIEEEAKKYATPWELMSEMLFCTSLAGEEIARLKVWGTGDERIGDYIAGSPCGLMDLPQLYMEPLLVKNAAARGASFAFNTEYLSHTQDETGVTVRLRDRLSQREYEVRAQYLVGADGARSRIVEELGLPLEGQLARAATAYVLFHSDLRRYVEHRPGILHWIMSPIAGYGEIGMGLLRAIRPWHTWIAGWGFDMAGEPDFSDDGVKARIRSYVGDPDLAIDIEASSVWYINQAYAPSYSVGRVFCGGDAVHRHPPSSGLGSNTCMQDAFNLAWKLAFVIQGHADASLLDSYSLERVPVGMQVVARANQSRIEYGPINECFRTVGQADPVAAGLAKLRDPGPEGVAIREALRQAMQVKASYEFNAQGVELNQRYASNAVIPDPDAGEEQWRRDPQVYLQATTRPGAKIPHTWLVDEAGQRVSTLDVTGKGKFSLVTGPAGRAWVEAVNKLNLPFLRTVVVGAKGAEDPYLSWAQIREIHEAGALLVRPDGYIAWRQSGAVWDDSDALTQLEAALQALLRMRS